MKKMRAMLSVGYRATRSELRYSASEPVSRSVRAAPPVAVRECAPLCEPDQRPQLLKDHCRIAGCMTQGSHGSLKVCIFQCYKTGQSLVFENTCFSSSKF